MNLQRQILNVTIIILLSTGFSTLIKSNEVERDQDRNSENSAEDTVKVTFIANAGFIISSGLTQIAMDAFFEGYHSGGHVEPSESIINKMKTCQELFQDIDIITISHEHLDHISTDIVGEHLECNSAALVLCDSVVAGMFEDYNNYEQIEDRIIDLTPELDSSLTDTIHDIEIKVFGFRHGKPMFYDMMNLAFLINLNGIKIFHSGDTQGEYMEELEAFHLNDEDIDIAFLHCDFFYASVDGIVSDGLQKVNQYISPKNIVLMHNIPSYLDGGYQIIDSIENKFPNIYIFDTEGEEKEFVNGKLVDEPVPINSNSLTDEMRIYPNPTQNFIYIDNYKKDTKEIFYKIISIDGKITMKGHLIDSVIDVLSLPSGLYFLRLEANDEIRHKIVLKE